MDDKSQPRWRTLRPTQGVNAWLSAETRHVISMSDYATKRSSPQGYADSLHTQGAHGIYGGSAVSRKKCSRQCDHGDADERPQLVTEFIGRCGGTLSHKNTMSLSALVYRSRGTLQIDVESFGAVRDDRTGENYFATSQYDGKSPREALIG